MLKSINKLIKERLAKGGPGSGRHPEGYTHELYHFNERTGEEKTIKLRLKRQLKDSQWVNHKGKRWLVVEGGKE